MPDHCARLRITQQGGFAGSLVRVELERSALDAEKARLMDEACRELAAAAGASATGEAEIGADMMRYVVEMDSPDGESRSFALGATGAETGGAEIAPIVERLASLSASGT